MNRDARLRAIRDVIQQDVGNRGLARDPHANLINACPDDFAAACRSLAAHPDPRLGVITGFYIPSARHAETDGPLGAVYLARTLPALGIPVQLAGEPLCLRALHAGLVRAGCNDTTPVLHLPWERKRGSFFCGDFWEDDAHYGLFRPVSHELALERPGPSHTPASVRAQPGATEDTVRLFLAEVPPEHHDRCHTMRGIDITEHVGDAGAEFDHPPGRRYPETIGIGDGGNEIGMGKIPWAVIRANLPNGALIACRVATDYLIVAGVSNWGAYALACGVAAVKGVTPPAEWFDLDRERDILAYMVQEGQIVDGVTGQFTPSVDGLPFEQYAEPLRRLGEIMRA